MARPERFELPTTWFVARYSIQLSYGRAGVRTIGAEPVIVNKKERSQTDLQFRVLNGGERGIRTLDRAINPILP